MKQTALIVEFLIIGLIGLVNLALLYMIIFQIDISQIQMNLEANKELVIPIGTFTIYVLGAVIHRVGGLIGYENFVKIANKLKLRYSQKDSSFNKKYHIVYQFGSDNVIERVFYNESMLRLFKSTTFLFFILGVLTIIWTTRLNKDFSIGLFVSITCFIISILCLISHSLQGKSFKRFIIGISEIIEKRPATNNA